MGKSPSINFNKDFESIRKRIGLTSCLNDGKNKICLLIVILYSFLTLLLFVQYKPRIICSDKREEENKISYLKLFMYYILVMFPLILYLFLS